MVNTPKVTPMWAVDDKWDDVQYIADKQVVDDKVRRAERQVQFITVVAGVFVPMPPTDAMCETANEMYKNTIRVWMNDDSDQREMAEVAIAAMRAALNAVLSPEGGA